MGKGSGALMYDLAVVIGRFQPVHNGHLQVLGHAMAIARHVVVLIGSDEASLNTRNPFSTTHRAHMIKVSLPEVDQNRVTCLGIRDYLYDNEAWVTAVQQKVTQAIIVADLPRPHTQVALVGCQKDRSSFYLKFFPQWSFVECSLVSGYDATQIRANFFMEHQSTPSTPFQWTDLGTVGPADRLTDPGPDWRTMVPVTVRPFLDAYRQSQDYVTMAAEFQDLMHYKRQWLSAPFPPTFVTVDALVVADRHMLVIRRGRAPGKGLLALPGGFIDIDEPLLDAAIRECREETTLCVFPFELVRQEVFSHPHRSARGRTITHAYYFALEAKVLPLVQGSDDASEAFWMPLDHLEHRASEFFEDHYHMITHLLSDKQGGRTQ
jgi:bifunctional NMN adenylyltransferase/nudix hydrolase